MKRRFDRALGLFLITGLLFTLAPGSAGAEEWIEEPGITEELLVTDEEIFVSESADPIVFEEVPFIEETLETELPGEIEQAPETDSLSEDIVAEQLIPPNTEDQIPGEQEPEKTVAFETEHTDAFNSAEGETPAVKAEVSPTQSDAATAEAKTEAVFSTDEKAAFAAPKAEADISFRARLNAGGNLDFFVTLPADAAEKDYVIVIDTGYGKTETFENKTGETEITVFRNVKPHQLTKNMTVSVRHQGKTFSCNVWEYLKQVPQQYPDLDMAQLVPANKARCSGEIKGVSNYRAKLDLTDNNTSILICFQAEDGNNLRFSCSGHNITAPKQVSNGIWCVSLSGISVNELPMDFAITAEKDGQKAELRFSPFCDAAAHWGEDTPVVILSRALTAVMAEAEKNSASDAHA